MLVIEENGHRRALFWLFLRDGAALEFFLMGFSFSAATQSAYK
jgi:hypothetical protein